jgi:ribulose-5-phosphate 4-epimerase/fuculose-1-phosphate aldolase
MSTYFDFTVTALGERQDYFPGTGGNISLKLDDGTMLIKASGKRILHLKDEDGIVALSYEKIKEHFYAAPAHKEGERISGDIIQLSLAPGTVLRPSIETGFHTLLSTAVIHSHSAYANMLTCSKTFESAVDTIFLGTHIPYLSIEYAQPGYYLTHLLRDKVMRLSGTPKVIFMKNHGVVVSASTLEEAVVLHEEVNDKIKRYFGFTNQDYPRGELIHESDVRSKSNTLLLHTFVMKNMHIFENIKEYILFPDLTVFCQDIYVTLDLTFPSKILIHKDTGEIIYNTTRKEAHCIEENLIAFAFLMTHMKEHNLIPFFISEQEADSIRNMEQEKYRKLLLQK